MTLYHPFLPHFTTLLTILYAVAQAQNQILATSPLSSFSYPPVSSRAKFRYWFPDASVSASALQTDIAALAEASAGGIQFLGFYNQGFPPISTDWSVYGFGTPAYKELLRTALRSTAEHGLLFDIAIGPNTGAGVPSIPGTEGLAMELVYGTKTLTPSEKAGALPLPVLEFNHQPLNGWVHEPENWGPSDLVAVVAAKVVSRGRKGSIDQVVLDEESVVNLLNFTRNGTLDWEAPSSGGSGQGAPPRWIVMAFYQRYSNDRSCVSVPKASTWIGNGSWTVDHFSAAGARKATEFWDQHIVDDEEINTLLGQVGVNSWEDSMEMMAPLWWTPNFLERFEAARGYSAVKYLPVFFQAKNLWNGYGDPYSTSYMFDGQPSDGGKYAEDYRLTLTEGYQDFLEQYQLWAAARGMNHSAQPAYNMPLDMSAAIPFVGVPELESLGFSESIDVYRQFTGPAHLSSRNSISTEIGAQRGGAYAQSVPKLLNLFRDSFAAGVNTLSIHGFAYGGPYAETTWPGYTPFQYEFCEMWGPRQPAWRHLNDTLLYAARNTEVLKTGRPKVDLAFYLWKQPWSAREVYRGPDLTAAGYTHEYVGPENLASASTLAKDGILAADGPAYKAIVVYGQTKITPSASAALLKFAEAGLPVFVVGQAPNTTIGARGQDQVSSNIAKLTNGTFPNVRVISVADFGAITLVEAGILPRVSIANTEGATNASQLFTTWRSEPGSGLDMVYLLNRGLETTFYLSFETPENAAPYVLDAWTGKQEPLVAYTRSESGISVVVTLAEQQSTIFAFAMAAKDESEAPLYVVSRSANLAHLHVNGNGEIEGLISDAYDASALLSNNVVVDIPQSEPGDNPSSLPTLNLGPWDLTVETFAAPSVLSTSSVLPNLTTISASSPLQTLIPWTKIRGFERSSGIGTYRTSFDLPSKSGADAMNYTLHFTGPVLNTIRVSVNGVPVPAIDLAAPAEGRDITGLLAADTENEVVVEVTSTLFNAVKARMGDLRSAGMGVHVPKYYTDVQWAEFGLVGEVVVKTWRRVLLT